MFVSVDDICSLVLTSIDTVDIDPVNTVVCVPVNGIVLITLVGDTVSDDSLVLLVASPLVDLSGWSLEVIFDVNDVEEGPDAIMDVAYVMFFVVVLVALLGFAN